MDSKNLSVTVPALHLMELARRFMNADFLATYTREVQSDSATDYTATQLMQVVKGLDDSFSHMSGMETVGKEIAATLRPLIMLPMSSSPEQQGQESEAISTLFNISPEGIKVLAASDAKIRDAMDESARHAATKFKAEAGVDNYETIFYMLQVLAVYYPKKKTFDFYHAYVYCRDTSIWQWTKSATVKNQRVAALTLEGTRLLGTTMARQSSGAITIVESYSAFADQKNAFV